MQESEALAANNELVSAAERDRLVRLCARLSGSPAAAEDLVQETLLEAWRARDRLREPASRPQWLAGIARNVCRRWRSRRAGTSHFVATPLTLEEVEVHLSDDSSLEVALERSEVAGLLDHALSLLPSGSRDLLVERYVEDLPVREIAGRHGLSEGAAAVRLHRGKRVLLQILQTQLRDEAIALGLLASDREAWQPTRIWCPCCGRARLEARRDLAVCDFAARCPACRHTTMERGAGYVGEVQGHWRTLLRVNREADRYYRTALAHGGAPCACCGHDVQLQFSIPRAASGLDRDVAGVHLRCEACGAVSLQPDVGLALTRPSVQRFWRANKRIHLAGRHETVSGGRDAVLIRFEAVATSAAMEVVSAVDTYQILHEVGVGTEERSDE